MFKLASIAAYLAAAAQYAAASPLPQADTTMSAASMTSGSPSASATDGATIVSGFVPTPGGPPNETLYVVTASDETYLAGIATVTATAQDGTPTTAVEKDLFVLTNGTIDYYTFNGTDYIIQAVECDVVDNGMTANCNGTLVDLSSGTSINQQNGINFSGGSSGVTAYQPTGSADPSAISFATAAPSLRASATSYLTSLLSSVSDEVSSATVAASAEVSSALAGASSEASAALPTDAASAGDGDNFTFTVGGQVITARP